MRKTELKNAFALVDAHPILADAGKLGYEVEKGVVYLYGESGQLRMAMPEADFLALRDYDE